MTANEKFYIESANLASQRSFCMRRKVGAVLVKDDHILLSSCNGSSSVCQVCVRNANNIKPGILHSTCNGMHAERRLLLLASEQSIDVRGATIYCTHSPCCECTLAIIEAGIAKFVYWNEYPDFAFKSLFKENGILYNRKKELMRNDN